MARPAPTITLRDVPVWQGYLSPADQQAMLDDLRAVVRAAPFYAPVTPRGQPMSVRMTAAGQFGWYSDRRGYRYLPHHPSGSPWPAIPNSIMAVWRNLSESTRDPECCLVNLYRDAARMGLHQDRDEADLTCPVLSVSLGDDALFRVGSVARGGKTESLWLRSGDVALLAGPSRLAHHGIDRVRPGSSALLQGGGRINLTLRVVT